MPTFKDLGTNVISEIGSGFGGPLGDLFNDKHGSTSLNFPSDVEGVGQRHFIRFNITTKTGVSFGSSGKNNEEPEIGALAELLGGIAGTALGDAVGGPLGGLAGGLATSAASSVLDEIGVDKIASDALNNVTSLAGEAVSGIATSLESTVGQLSDQAGKFKDTVAEKVPIAEDALNGIGSFIGSIGGIAESFADGIGGETKTEGDIVMYMPFSLTEAYQVTWQGGAMGIFGAMGGALADAAATKSIAPVMAQLSGTNLKGAAAETVGNILGAKLGNDSIPKKMLKEMGNGVAVNPHWELFFEGVQPRTFSFDFKLSPKNASEADAIQKIIKMFKTFAAPNSNVGGSRRYWGYPSMFEIEYWNSEKLHKLKPCALTNIAVNYSGDGTNHTFYDGSPLQTDLTLSFMEGELLTRQDMAGGY